MGSVIFQDDLPAISASRLRATGVITAEMTRTTIAGVEVDLHLVKFANGGSWSFFRCPSCDRGARTLKLFDGFCTVLALLPSSRCAVSRAGRVGLRGRAELRIPKLRAMLETPASLRLKPHCGASWRDVRG